MLKGFKTEIYPTEEQIVKIHQMIGVCRYLYNAYLSKNQELYNLYKEGKIDKKQAFMSAIDFDKYINNDIKIQDEFKWIDETCGSKARKKSICNAETAYKRFFNGQSEFPKYKKKKNQNVKAYFPKNNKKDWEVERHRVKIPTLGFVRLKEKAYIPINANVKSGTISMKAGRYYVSALVEVTDYNDYSQSTNEGIGIDLGIKDLAICSNNMTFKNINKTKEVKRFEKLLKRLQKQCSRKYEMNKIGKAFIKTKNIIKVEEKIRIVYQRLNNIRNNYIHTVTNMIVKTKPEYIVIEDLNVKGMMKNRHLSKAVAQQKIYEFRRQLEYKCKWNNIELRIVDRFYPSSKTCNVCGYIKKDLKLSDRTFICPECGVIEDRDYNASLNLRDAKLYKIA